MQVLVTRGREDLDMARLGLNTALTAASSGIPVTVFFTLRGTQLACAAHDASDPAADVIGLLHSLVDLGAELECCSVCLDKYCIDQAVDPTRGLHESVRLAGLASVVRRSSEGVSTITF